MHSKVVLWPSANDCALHCCETDDLTPLLALTFSFVFLVEEKTRGKEMVSWIKKCTATFISYQTFSESLLSLQIKRYSYERKRASVIILVSLSIEEDQYRNLSGSRKAGGEEGTGANPQYLKDPISSRL